MNDDLQYTERARMLKNISVKNYSEVRAREVATVHARNLHDLIARARKKTLAKSEKLVDTTNEVSE